MNAQTTQSITRPRRPPEYTERKFTALREAMHLLSCKDRIEDVEKSTAKPRYRTDGSKVFKFFTNQVHVAEVSHSAGVTLSFIKDESRLAYIIDEMARIGTIRFTAYGLDVNSFRRMAKGDHTGSRDSTTADMFAQHFMEMFCPDGKGRSIAEIAKHKHYKPYYVERMIATAMELLLVRM